MFDRSLGCCEKKARVVNSITRLAQRVGLTESVVSSSNYSFCVVARNSIQAGLFHHVAVIDEHLHVVSLLHRGEGSKIARSVKKSVTTFVFPVKLAIRSGTPRSVIVGVGLATGRVLSFLTRTKPKSPASTNSHPK